MATIAEKNQDRAFKIAQLAAVLKIHPIKEAVKEAEELLVAAEDLVAKEYGEFR